MINAVISKAFDPYPYILLNLVLEFFIGQRVSVETEIAGLDIPEMGQLGYPEFVFREEATTFTRAPQEFAVA